MHSSLLHLAPVMAAEKSKVPFYIAGGVLVLWALFISMAVGMRQPDFPSGVSQQRLVVGVSAVLVAVAIAMAIATSGGEAKSASKGSASTGSQTKTQLQLAANPEGQLSYNTKALSAPAGTVTITMANMSSVDHNVTIAQGSKVLGSTPTFAGGSRSVSLKLAPGTYTFYCSVPGHRQAGMEGTLTVS